MRGTLTQLPELSSHAIGEVAEAHWGEDCRLWQLAELHPARLNTATMSAQLGGTGAATTVTGGSREVLREIVLLGASDGPSNARKPKPFGSSLASLMRRVNTTPPGNGASSAYSIFLEATS
jgi:hypothetical protein